MPRSSQRIDSDQLTALMENQEALLVELRAQTFYLREGFLINDETEQVREDIKEDIAIEKGV